MMQRSVSSADSASIVSPSACHIGLVSALSFSGRLSIDRRDGAVALDRDQFGHGALVLTGRRYWTRPSPVTGT